jgi:hypothetical protein
MAKELIQVVAQDNQQGQFGPIAKRIFIQFLDTDSSEDDQLLVEYDEMTTEAKAIYDTFIQMCEAYLTT